MLQEQAVHALAIAARVAAISGQHFHLAAQALLDGACGALLPELAVGLLVLQLQAPLLLAESDCVPLVRKLIQPLDDFNQAAVGAAKEEREDLSWPGVRGKPLH